MNKKCFLPCVALCVLFLPACAPSMPEGWTYRSESEIRDLEVTSKTAFDAFQKGNYAESERILIELTKEQNVSTPLYLAELAVTKMALGKRDEAREILKRVRKLWDEMSIKSTEDKAESVFSAEFNKLFRGESYEYSTLYMIVGLFYLEENDVDNALACFKNALLRDADVSSDLYSSDYAMLLWLEALCHDMRGEKETAAKLRNMTAVALFESVPENISGLSANQQRIVTAYLNTMRVKKLQRMVENEAYKDIKDELLESISSLSKQTEEMTKEMSAVDINNEFTALEKGKLYEYLVSLPAYSALKDPKNVVFIWSGSGPSLTLTGDYKELREIHGGSNVGNLFFIIPDSEKTKDIEAYVGCEFGDVSYQAITRGPREMDVLLQEKANTKKTTHTISTGLMLAGAATVTAAQFVPDNRVKTGMIIGGTSAIIAGTIGNAIAAAMTPEADARYWKNIPNMFLMFSVPSTMKNEHCKLLCFYDSVLVSVHDINLEAQNSSKDDNVNIHQLFIGNPHAQALKLIESRKIDPAQKATTIFVQNPLQTNLPFRTAATTQISDFVTIWSVKYPKPENELDGLKYPPPESPVIKSVHSYFINTFFK